MIKKLFFKIKNNTLVSHMAGSAICKPISMVISYLYVPMVLNYLGVEKYGVWSTILTILSWISYFDIGIGNGLRNKLTNSITKKDGYGRQLVSSAYAFIATIMTVVTIAFSIVAIFMDWNKIFGVNDISENLTAVVIISVIFIAINFVLSICKNVLFALQKAANVSIMELSTQIINVVGVFIATHLMSGNLFVMATIYGIAMVSVNLVASIIIYKKNLDLCPGIRFVDFTVGKDLTELGIKFFVIQICALVLFTTDSLIISYLYGAAEVTPYSTINKIFNLIIGVYAAMLSPVWSAVAKTKAEKNYVYLRNMIKKLNIIMLILAIVAVGMGAFCRPIMKIWLQKELNFTTSLIVFGVAYCILTNWCNTYAYVSNGLELMKVSIITAVIQAMVNIPASLFFAKFLHMKSAGVLAGTVFSMMIAAVVQPIAVHNTIKKNI